MLAFPRGEILTSRWMNVLSGRRAFTPSSIVFWRSCCVSLLSHYPLLSPSALLVSRLLIYHCGAELEMRGLGPFFYCSKVEHYLEARLWNAIFTWTETRLGLKKVRRLAGG